MINSSHRRSSQKVSSKKSTGSQNRSKEAKRNTFHIHHHNTNATAPKQFNMVIDEN